MLNLKPTSQIYILPRSFHNLLHLTVVIKLRSKFMFKTVKIPHHTLALQDQHFEHLRIDEENLEYVLPQYTLALHDLFENSLSSAVFVTCVFLKLDGNESLRME